MMGTCSQGSGLFVSFRDCVLFFPLAPFFSIPHIFPLGGVGPFFPGWNTTPWAGRGRGEARDRAGSLRSAPKSTKNQQDSNADENRQQINKDRMSMEINIKNTKNRTSTNIDENRMSTKFDENRTPTKIDEKSTNNKCRRKSTTNERKSIVDENLHKKTTKNRKLTKMDGMGFIGV